LGASVGILTFTLSVNERGTHGDNSKKCQSEDTQLTAHGYTFALSTVRNLNLYVRTGQRENPLTPGLLGRWNTLWVKGLPVSFPQFSTGWMGWDGVKLGQVFGADLRAEGQCRSDRKRCLFKLETNRIKLVARD
jgi:hypothetical protein